MKITKYQHACLDITLDKDRLIIDPGVYATSLTNLSNITALVITHVHPDHFDAAKVAEILKQNPDIKIFSTQEVLKELPVNNLTVPIVGSSYEVGDFTLQFFGEKHAAVMPSFPIFENIGVLVNNTLYYPGDSFTACTEPHSVVGVPSMGPWMKISEAVAFITDDERAKTLFPTHDGFLNDAGWEMHNMLLTKAAKPLGKTFVPLKPGSSIEV